MFSMLFVGMECTHDVMFQMLYIIHILFLWILEFYPYFQYPNIKLYSCFVLVLDFGFILKWVFELLTFHHENDGFWKDVAFLVI